MLPPLPGALESCSGQSKYSSPANSFAHDVYYRSSGQGDVFLFSPSLCSHASKHSASQSSSVSFDAFSCTYSPADLSSAPKPLSFSPHPYPSPRVPCSPAFVEAYLSGAEPKPIARHTPGTPFQDFLNSSPAGYWQAGSLSVSPISRHSDYLVDMDIDVDSADESESVVETTSPGRFASLLTYGEAQDMPDSPSNQRPSSPSSLSSLSSVPSSPSVLSAGDLHMHMPSSQTSVAGTSSCSPAKGASSLSPLGSPFKLSSEFSAPSRGSVSTRRSKLSLPALRFTRRSLAANILNRLGRSSGHAESSSLKISSSPAPPASDSDDENYDPASGARRSNRKRARLPAENSESYRQKRQRRDHTPAAATSPSTTRYASDIDGPPPSGPSYPNRTLPLRVPIHDNFPLFYRRFAVSSVVDARLAASNNLTVLRVPDAISNEPRDLFDLYTPRFVKGKGTTKVGLCPICHEKTERGGEGKKVWLSMKFSAFKCYHMQYAHGISATTGRPFSPPIAFRTVQRHNAGKHEKTRLMEGKCHKCQKWVAVEGIKDVPSKVKEIFWWKHAAACHQGSMMDGEADVFVEDEVYAAAVSMLGTTDEDAEGEEDAEDEEDAECEEDAKEEDD